MGYVYRNMNKGVTVSRGHNVATKVSTSFFFQKIKRMLNLQKSCIQYKNRCTLG